MAVRLAARAINISKARSSLDDASVAGALGRSDRPAAEAVSPWSSAPFCSASSCSWSPSASLASLLPTLWPSLSPRASSPLPVPLLHMRRALWRPRHADAAPPLASASALPVCRPASVEGGGGWPKGRTMRSGVDLRGTGRTSAAGGAMSARRRSPSAAARDPSCLPSPSLSVVSSLRAAPAPSALALLASSLPAPASSSASFSSSVSSPSPSPSPPSPSALASSGSSPPPSLADAPPSRSLRAAAAPSRLWRSSPAAAAITAAAKAARALGAGGDATPAGGPVVAGVAAPDEAASAAPGGDGAAGPHAMTGATGERDGAWPDSAPALGGCCCARCTALGGASGGEYARTGGDCARGMGEEPCRLRGDRGGGEDGS